MSRFTPAPFTALPLGLALGFFFAAPCSASLVLTINTGLQSFSYSGSDTGTLGTAKGTGILVWTDADSSNPTSIPLTGLSWSGDGLIDADNTYTAIFDSSNGAADALRVQVFFSGGSGAEGTLTADSTVYSYAGASLQERAYFESLIGSSVPLDAGSGFSPIAVVPEPSASLLSLLGAVIILRRRRRC